MSARARAGVAALAAGLLFAAASATALDAPAAAPSPAAAPRIVIEPASFEFGTVRAGRVVEKEFFVRNHGRADLAILSLTSSCGCTAVLTESKTVKPGASTALRVTLTAPEEPGRLVKSVLVKSNDPVHPSIEVKLEATIAPAKK